MLRAQVAGVFNCLPQLFPCTVQFYVEIGYTDTQLCGDGIARLFIQIDSL